MKELSKEELVEILDEWLRITIDAYLLDEDEISVGKDQQAYQQIRKLVEGKPRVTRAFIEEWLEEKWREDWCDPSYYKVLLSWLIDLLKEAGVEVEK